MKIVITTPLYPPEISKSAIYSKKLAELLNQNNHSVTIITYSTIPEKIDGVEIIKINKNLPLPIRIILYFKELWSATKNSDLIYSQNGASVELPIYIISLLKKNKFFIHIGDKIAYEGAKNNFVLKLIQNITFNRARKIIKDNPLEKPEILPFKEFPKKEMGEYEKSWTKHIQLLENIFKNESN